MLKQLMQEDIREKEREFFEAERTRVPHLFEREPMVDSGEFLLWIGVEIQDENLPIGYLKLLPQDFVVEEISRDGALHTADVDSDDPDFSQEGKGLYADLVKIGISTLEAQSQIAESLSINPQDIGYAGIKDRAALTAQAISVRNLQEKEKIKEVSADNFFLKNIKSGKGAIANGELQGNRFIITVRIADAFSQERITKIEKQLEEIKEQGFWNFFSFQRFGTPRLLSHRLGLHIIKGEFQDAVKLFFCHPSPRELPYFKDVRSKLKDSWGDWKNMKTLINQFPYHFSIELKFINHLLEHPTDFLGALHAAPDQIRLWIYAYDSYLFNKKLSQLIAAGEVPFKLPLLTSFNQKDWEPYEEFLKEDGVDIPSRYYKKFPSIRIASRMWPVLQQVEIHNAVFQDKLAVFAFTLPKGAYATTFLMNFFTLASGLPVISGISQEKIDAKKLLGLGSLETTLERFESVLEAREQDISRDAEV